MSVLRDLMRISPIDAGTMAPPLSLTADEGTWVRVRDFQGHMAVVLLFFKEENSDTEQWLSEWSQAKELAEQLDAVIFGVHTAKTERLRDFRAHLRGQFFFLYDPFALTARAYGMSSRALPMCKDGVVLIGRDQKVLFAERGQPDSQSVLRRLAEAEGKPMPGQELPESTPASTKTSSGARNPGQAQQAVGDLDGPQAHTMLTEQDSPYILVDVRTKSEFDADHSVVAIHIPVDELPHRYQDLGQTTHILFVCQGGDRSAAAAEFMVSIGAHEIYNVVEGMSAWTGPRERTVVGD